MLETIESVWSTNHDGKPGSLYAYRDFVRDPDRWFWPLLDEFYGLDPIELVTPATVRLVAGGERAPSRRRWSDITQQIQDGAPAKRNNHFSPHVAMLAGMVGQALPKFGMPDVAAMALYRDGADFIDHHIDAPQLSGPEPDDVRVAIVSFGADRPMHVRPIMGNPEPVSSQVIPLFNGALVTMQGALQDTHTHAIPATSDRHPRLSVTFAWRPTDYDASEIPVALQSIEHRDSGLICPWFVGSPAAALRRYCALPRDDRASHELTHPSLEGRGQTVRAALDLAYGSLAAAEIEGRAGIIRRDLLHDGELATIVAAADDDSYGAMIASADAFAAKQETA